MALECAASEVSAGQLGLLAFYLSVSLVPFTVGADALANLGRWGWAAALPAAALGLGGAWIAAGLRRRDDQDSVVATARRLAGPWVGAAYGAVLAIVLSLAAALTLHALAQVVRAELLPTLPAWIPAGIGAGICAYGAFLGLGALCRWAQVLALVVVPALAATLLVPWINAEPAQLQPLWAVPWGGLWHGWASFALAAGSGFAPLLFVAPAGGPAGPANPGPQVCGGQACAAAVWILASALPIAVLGPEVANLVRFPLLRTVGTVTWRWLPLHRLGVLSVAAWAFLAYVTVAVDACLGAAAWRQALGRAAALGQAGPEPGRLVAALIAAAAGAAACWSPGSGANAMVLSAWGFAALGALFAVPALLLVLPRRAAPP